MATTSTLEAASRDAIERYGYEKDRAVIPRPSDQLIYTRSKSEKTIKPRFLASEDQRDSNGLRIAYEFIKDEEGNESEDHLITKPISDEDLEPEAQAALEAEYQALQKAKEIVDGPQRTPEELIAEQKKLGEEALDDVPINKPATGTGTAPAEHNPWAQEAQKKAMIESSPSLERPRILDNPYEVTYVGADGKSERGLFYGMIVDPESGRNQGLVAPGVVEGAQFDPFSPNIDRRIMFIEDMSRFQSVSQGDVREMMGAEPLPPVVVSPELVQKMSGEIPDSLDAMIAGLPEASRKRDEIELRSYASTDSMLLSSPNDAALNAIKKQNWTRMSPEARAIARSYSDRVNGVS